jgi:hypothetical protein
MLFAGCQVHEWRYHITDRYIRGSVCKRDAAARDGLILGGIEEIRIDGVEERTGAFQNLSHCLSVVCAEEFYYCDDATVVIGP